MTEENVLYRIEDGVAVVTPNRPEKLNAVTPDMYPLLLSICEEIKKDDAVRVAVVTGAGRAFCAGMDLSSEESGSSEMRDHRMEQLKNASIESRFSNWSFSTIPKPTICAINGAAVGVGAEIPLHCDIRITSESARFG